MNSRLLFDHLIGAQFARATDAIQRQRTTVGSSIS
jgi:hypothetical protein